MTPRPQTAQVMAGRCRLVNRCLWSLTFLRTAAVENVQITLPYGMASRHLAGASISQVTDAVAIVVSESSMVRVFDDGKLVAEIIPELWLMDHYNVQMSQPYQEERVGDLAVLTAKA